MIPQSLAASIGERWFGPTLCARVVPLIEHLDLRVMQDIANELVRRGDHLTLSYVVSRIPPPPASATTDCVLACSADT